MRLVELADADDQDLLDDYIEAQVHGGVDVDRDVSAPVLDPSCRGTEVEADAHLLGVTLEWHAGFAATVGAIAQHPDYRGSHIVVVAARIASTGLLTPRVVGDAARNGREDVQDLKCVWHHLARFGHPT